MKKGGSFITPYLYLLLLVSYSDLLSEFTVRRIKLGTLKEPLCHLIDTKEIYHKAATITELSEKN